jgi:hypothetical protein
MSRSSINSAFPERFTEVRQSPMLGRVVGNEVG